MSINKPAEKYFGTELEISDMHSIVWTSVLGIAGVLSVIRVIHFVGTHRLFAEPRKAQAFAAIERIRIDGSMDEPEWRSGTPIGSLVQVLPKEGDEPSERTSDPIIRLNKAVA